jgi:hypothetical protein
MRHFVAGRRGVLGSVAPLPLCMPTPTVPAALVATPSLTQGAAPSGLRTTPRAINIAPVTAATDMGARAATSAEEGSIGRHSAP